MGNDVEAEKARLESELRSLDQTLEHPFFNEVRAFLRDETDRLSNAILDSRMSSIASFAEREQAIGHLRGLREVQNLLNDARQTLIEQIADL